MSSRPSRIGKYDIVGEIGRGSMGTVYSARDNFSDRMVALKVAHPQFVDGSESGKKFRKLFFNEAHAAGVLRHPNILRVFDADVHEDVCYIVMEYIEGARTLEDHIRADSLLSLNEVVGIIYRCARALDYAHRQGIKPLPGVHQCLLSLS